MSSEKNRIKLQGFLADKLKWHAYTHIYVADDDMAPATHFLHTVGRARDERPELIITGVADPQLAIDIIADVVAFDAAHGLADGQQPGDAVRVPVRLADVSTDAVRKQRVAQSASRFGSAIQVFQILWADAASRFPGDADYDQNAFPQQHLGSLQ